jgi:hypothetical protein
MADPKVFYTEQLPAQWNRALRDQEREADTARRTYEGMKAVNATIRVDVRGEGAGTFFLNVADGVLTPGEEAANPPFLTLVQDRPDFERLAAEAGDSALGFLGGISGLAGEMKLTHARIEQLRCVEGCLRFELQGEGGFTLLTLFGSAELPDEPTTTIAVQRSAYQALKNGELNPQDAFINGSISVEGDMQVAMQIALAALAPD